MSTKEVLTVVAVGDIALNGRYSRHRVPPWNGVPAFWDDCDLRTGNLESPLTTARRFADSKLVLRACPTADEILAVSRFDVLSLANNHMMDFGPPGLQQTVERVRALGIDPVGCGLTLSKAFEPCIIEKGPQRIAVLSFCDVFQESPLYAEDNQLGVAPLDEGSYAVVEAIRPKVDWLILHLHWGTEMCRLPSPDQRNMARRFVDVGADAIIGHHPHVLQPMEIIGKVPVWYSLGNFAFSGGFWEGKNSRGEAFAAEYYLHPLARKSGVARFTLKNGDAPQYEFYPTSIRADGTVAVDTSSKSLDGWRALCDRLQDPAYLDDYGNELACSTERFRWQSYSSSIYRRMRVKAFQAGLMAKQGL